MIVLQGHFGLLIALIGKINPPKHDQLRHHKYLWMSLSLRDRCVSKEPLLAVRRSSKAGVPILCLTLEH